MNGQAAFLLSTIVHGDFWREGGEAEAYLAGHPLPEIRDALQDLTTFIADRIARNMQAVMQSPGLRDEYEAIDGAKDWTDEDLLCFKAAMLAHGLLGGES